MRWVALALLLALTAAAFAGGVLAGRARVQPTPESAAPPAPIPPSPPAAAPAPLWSADIPIPLLPVPVPTPAAPAAPLSPPAVSAPPAVGRLEAQPAGRWRVGEVAVQEVTVSRRAAFRLLGVATPQAAEYVFTSRLTVEAIGPDGSLTVRQRVEGTRLTACDPTTRATTEDALTRTRGTTFELAVGPDGVVTAIKGAADPVRVQEGADLFGQQTFRVGSLLDADGWKELAGLTFFQPARPLAAGAEWTRPAAHSWGPLGGWAGQTRYVAAGKRDGAERVEYAHALSYRPPAGGGGGLPFRVVRAEFRAPAAGGVIRYDAAAARATGAEEAFRVRGGLVVAVAGTEAAVEVEEEQQFRLRILDPAAVLRGGPPR